MAATERKPRTRVRDAKATQAKILEAALDCVEEFGFSETSMNKVLETANVGRGALFHHFANKTELMAAALSHSMWNRVNAFNDFMRDNDVARLGLSERLAAYRAIKKKHFFAFHEITLAMRTNAELKARFYEISDAPCPQFALLLPEFCDPAQPEHRCSFVSYLLNGLEIAGIFTTPDVIDRTFSEFCKDLDTVAEHTSVPSAPGHRAMLY